MSGEITRIGTKPPLIDEVEGGDVAGVLGSERSYL